MQTVITFIAQWWYWIILALAVLIGFIALPISKKYTALKEWLKYAVTLAEQELGSGTGQLKLRLVYDWFLEQFKILAAFISFDTFSALVDKALEWLNEQLESNGNIAAFVDGGSVEIMDILTENAEETETAEDSE